MAQTDSHRLRAIILFWNSFQNPAMVRMVFYNPGMDSTILES
jgi:hypothetical protein